jgi:hypothetical protein
MSVANPKEPQDNRDRRPGYRFTQPGLRTLQQLGLSHADASSGLAQVLLQIIDHMTLTGQVAADHGDMLKQALSMLNKKT